MFRKVSLLTAVGSALAVFITVQGSLGLDNRDSQLLYGLHTTHNRMYNGQNRTFGETLRLFWEMRTFYNAGTNEFKTLIEASEISKEKCNGNFSLEYDRLIRENAFDQNNTVPYLEQSKIAQSIICLRIKFDEALSAIGEKNRMDMENLAERFGESRLSNTRNPVLAFFEEKMGPLCTSYMHYRYEKIYNQTIGEMARVINSEFSPLLMAANDLRDHVDLEPRLTSLEMKWLFSYAPMAAQLDTYLDDAFNATRRGLHEYCENQTSLGHYPGFTDPNWGININSLMQGIAKHCSTDRIIGTIVFPLNKAKFVDGLLDYIEREELTESTLVNGFEQIFSKLKSHLCTPYLEAMRGFELRTDLGTEEKNTVGQSVKVCRYITHNLNSLRDATYTVYSNRHSFVH